MTIKNDQQAFIHVKDHLLKQKTRSMQLTNDNCLYRGYLENEIIKIRDVIEKEVLKEKYGINVPENDDWDEEEFWNIQEIIDDQLVTYPISKGSCAVGCLVKDDCYDEIMENNGAGEEIVLQFIRASHSEWIITDNSIYLLKLLQNVHDSITPDSWVKRFDELSKFFTNNQEFDIELFKDSPESISYNNYLFKAID